MCLCETMVLKVVHPGGKRENSHLHPVAPRRPKSVKLLGLLGEVRCLLGQLAQSRDCVYRSMIVCVEGKRTACDGDRKSVV